jgi:hypothetical protein
MSNNHPTDNIYSILGKLAALKPTPEEKRFALVKEIRESVEAQGSITEGVNSVETKLRKQLAESKLDELSPSTLGSYAKKSSADAAKRQGKVTGTNQFHKGSEFAVKAFYGDTIQSRPDRTDPKIAQRQAGVGKAVDRLTKECTMCEAGDCNEHGVREAEGSDKGWVPNPDNPGYYIHRSDLPQTGKVSDPVKAKLGRLINRYFGKIYNYGNSDDSLDYLDNNAPLWNSLFDKHDGDIDAIISNEPADMLKKAALELKTVANDLKYELDEAVAEGEVKKIPGGVRHTKTDYPGYPTDDTLDNLDNLKGPGGGVRKGRPLKAQTKNPRRDPNAPKKGRGRPATAKSGPVSMPSDPFGRVTGRVPKGRKGTVHTVDEAMRLVARNLMVMEGMNFKRMMEEQHMSLAEMVECMTADLKVFKETGVCSDSLRDMMEVYGHAKRQADEGIEQPQQGGIGDVMSPQDKQAKMARLTPSAPGVMGAVKDIGKGLSDFVRGRPETTSEEFDPLEEELNELARLAGLSTEGNAFTGKLKSTPKGGKFDLDGKEYTDTSTLDEEPNEGNAFGQAVRNAKADGIQPGEKVRVGDKQYPVKEAQELVAMLKVAGIDTKQLEEAIEQATQVRGIPVHKPVTPPVTDFGSDNDDEGETCPECDGAGCPECYGDEHRDRAHAHAQGMERESAGMAEGRMSEIDMLYQDWVNSEYAPFDSDSGNENLVIGKAQQFLRGKVNPAEIEDIADIMSNHWHGGRGVMDEDLQADSGQYYEDSADFFGMFEQDHFDEEKESDDGMEIRGYIDGKCVMAWRFNGPDMTDGYGAYDDSELVDETDLANAPNEKYDTIDATMRTGDADSTGAHRNFGGPGDNLMQQPPNVPARPVRSVKEAILSAEYESIKKSSK